MKFSFKSKTSHKTPHVKLSKRLNFSVLSAQVSERHFPFFFFFPSLDGKFWEADAV